MWWEELPEFGHIFKLKDDSKESGAPNQESQWLRMGMLVQLNEEKSEALF